MRKRKLGCLSSAMSGWYYRKSNTDNLDILNSWRNSACTSTAFIYYKLLFCTKKLWLRFQNMKMIYHFGLNVYIFWMCLHELVCPDELANCLHKRVWLQTRNLNVDSDIWMCILYSSKFANWRTVLSTRQNSKVDKLRCGLPTCARRA